MVIVGKLEIQIEATGVEWLEEENGEEYVDPEDRDGEPEEDLEAPSTGRVWRVTSSTGRDMGFITQEKLADHMRAQGCILEEFRLYNEEDEAIPWDRVEEVEEETRLEADGSRVVRWSVRFHEAEAIQVHGGSYRVHGRYDPAYQGEESDG